MKMDLPTNVLYLDDFLTFEDNLIMSLDSDEAYPLSSIHELEEYRLSKFVKNEGKYGSPAAVEGLEGSARPRRDNAPEDMYRPKKIRGVGSQREGYCEDCRLWFRLKTSSYWYHMNYKHGINSSGARYPEPETRCRDRRVESFCGACNDWVVVGTKKKKKSIRFGWYRHWQKRHCGGSAI
jgi:hypothetical protein